MKDKIFDPIRKIWIQALPEEIVRQCLIKTMLKDLLFPKSLLAVEKDLKSLPHLQNIDFNAKKRRADILCFAKGINRCYPLFPLLMIECKALQLNNSVVEQVVGYNHYVKASFVAIANAEKIITLWHNKKENIYKSIDFLPSYNQLLKAVKNNE